VEFPTTVNGVQVLLHPELIQVPEQVELELQTALQEEREHPVGIEEELLLFWVVVALVVDALEVVEDVVVALVVEVVDAVVALVVDVVVTGGVVAGEVVVGKACKVTETKMESTEEITVVSFIDAILIPSWRFVIEEPSKPPKDQLSEEDPIVKLEIEVVAVQEFIDLVVFVPLFKTKKAEFSQQKEWIEQDLEIVTLIPRIWVEQRSDKL